MRAVERPSFYDAQRASPNVGPISVARATYRRVAAFGVAGVSLRCVGAKPPLPPMTQRKSVRGALIPTGR
jgi:hypothetical protein